MSMFGPSQEEHDRALQKIKTLDRLLTESEGHLNSYRHEAKTHEEKMAVLTQTNQQLRSAVREHEQAAQTLRTNLEAITQGHAHFLKLGELRIRISSINTFEEKDGYVKMINGQDMFGLGAYHTIKIEALEGLIAAYHRKLGPE